MKSQFNLISILLFYCCVLLPHYDFSSVLREAPQSVLEAFSERFYFSGATIICSSDSLFALASFIDDLKRALLAQQDKTPEINRADSAKFALKFLEEQLDNAGQVASRDGIAFYSIFSNLVNEKYKEHQSFDGAVDLDFDYYNFSNLLDEYETYYNKRFNDVYFHSKLHETEQVQEQEQKRDHYIIPDAPNISQVSFSKRKFDDSAENYSKWDKVLKMLSPISDFQSKFESSEAKRIDFGMFLMNLTTRFLNYRLRNVEYSDSMFQSDFKNEVLRFVESLNNIYDEELKDIIIIESFDFCENVLKELGKDSNNIAMNSNTAYDENMKRFKSDSPRENTFEPITFYPIPAPAAVDEPKQQETAVFDAATSDEVFIATSEELNTPETRAFFNNPRDSILNTFSNLDANQLQEYRNLYWGYIDENYRKSETDKDAYVDVLANIVDCALRKSWIENPKRNK